MTSKEKSQKIYGFVKMQTIMLCANTSTAKAGLAQLRRGAGKSLESYPAAWNILLDGIDEDLLSYRGEPSAAQQAIWTALTLFATHQQGKQISMSWENVSLGTAAQMLEEKKRGKDKNSETKSSIARRYDAAITAKDEVEFSHHARGLIQLMRASDIGMDYPKFASDLFWFQFPHARSKICLEWGEDFYCKRIAKEKTDES